LRVLYGIEVNTVKADAGSVDSCQKALRECASELTVIDGLYVPMGMSVSFGPGQTWPACPEA